MECIISKKVPSGRMNIKEKLIKKVSAGLIYNIFINYLIKSALFALMLLKRF